MTEETNQTQSDKAQNMKLQAAKALQNHFSLNPDSVMVVSVSGGKAQVDVTEFTSTSEMLFAAKLLNKYVDQTFENVLLQTRVEKEKTQ